MLGHARSLPPVLLALLALVLGLVLVPTPASAEPGVDDAQWYDGRNTQNQVTNCQSIGVLSPYPYSEPGVATYTGYLADPDDAAPSVNQTTYMHYLVWGMGNPCNGTYFQPQFFLPDGVTWDTSQPIHCFYDGVNGYPSDTQACPQWGAMSQNGIYWRYASQIPNVAGTWPIAQGHVWEFQLPIRSNRVISGEPLRTFVKTIDGNDNLTLETSVPLYVFGGSGSGQTAIMYSDPSTQREAQLPDNSGPSAYGVVSRYQSVISGQGGTAFVELGTSPSALPKRIEIPITAGQFQAFELWTDWSELGPLRPGTRYYWRGGFTPTGGAPTRGAVQSFTLPASGTCQGRPVTVFLGLGDRPTAGNDVILGTAGNDNIDGLAGNDTICGLGGNDDISGGAGNDVLDGGEGNDRLLPGAGTNRVLGGGGNDTVVALGGNDAIDGGAGLDTASYAGATRKVVVDLAKSGNQNTGAGGVDSFRTVENVVAGKAGSKLSGNGAANVLTGGAGKDTLVGRGGADLMIGGAGKDTCDGGPGKDKARGCEKRKRVP